MWTIVLAALGSLIVIALGLAVAAFVYQDEILGRFARERARLLGVDLDFDAIALRGTDVALQNARARLLGVRNVDAQATELVIHLDGMQLTDVLDGMTLDGVRPTGVTATGAVVVASGSAADLALDLSAWTTRYPETYRVPAAASGVVVRWSEVAQGPAWLAIDDGALASTAAGGKLVASRLVVSGVEVGAAGATWASDGTAIAIGIGTDSLATAMIRADVRPKDDPPTATIALRPVTLAALGAPLGVVLPVPGAIAEGKAELVLERGEGAPPGTDAFAGTDAFSGTLEAKLTGWVPPHPPDLDGIVHGQTTTFSSKLHVPGDRRSVTLSSSAVTAGALHLTGGGTIQRAGASATVRMELVGSVPCAAVVTSAAATRVGGAVGKLIGELARKAIGGSVAVAVHVAADTANLAAARVTHDIGVGCKARLP